jgi:hypothetical protein
VEEEEETLFLIDYMEEEEEVDLNQRNNHK